ncbi:MFS transporter [Erwinia mallotivora]|uniref:Membrane protein n=1 Tax=Erwinia mallotivora TaxID=69222 RepID=A0A014NCY7_9GAMM|nr:MFS transporter [Erwinia mallotivora]EXU77248.1 membrane protein [Erwinia mallotivora]
MSASRQHLFSYAAFRHLFFARLLTVTGNGIAPIALAFAVLDMGGNAGDLGIVVASRSLINVLFLLPGGVLADRYSRTRLLFSASVIAALSQGLCAWLVLEHVATIGELIILGMINGAAAGMALPASGAMVPLTVPGQKLRQANAFIQLGIYVGTITGASLGGMLIGAVGPGWGLAVDALGFAAATPLWLLIRVGKQRVATLQRNMLYELREGWKTFIAHTWVWSVVAQFAVVNVAFSGIVMVLGPVIADASFGRTVWGVMVAAQSGGLIAGSCLALRWRPRRDMQAGVMLIALCALPMLLLSIPASSFLLCGAFFLAGVGFGQFGVVWAHYLQTRIPADKLARICAWDAMGSFIAIPLGELAAGPLALQLGNKTVLVISAVAVLVATLATSLVPAIRLLTREGEAKS